METEFKPAPRTPLHFSVRFRRNYAREACEGVLKNLSSTGAFLIEDQQQLMPGDKLSLSVDISGRHRDLVATVVWRNSKGCGLKFMPATGRDTQIVVDLIDFVEEKRSDRRSIMDQIFKRVS